jgi:tetratricopeptide (TPR) repeat protein
MLCLADARAGDASFTNLLVKGESAAQHNDLPGTLKYYSQASRLAGTNCADLCTVARYYCESMPYASSPEIKKNLAGFARDCSSRAIKAAPTNALAHLALAISYGKSFPFADDETKVKWSRALKEECEKTLSLDPAQDIAYYLLGRWNLGIANMNIFVRGLVKLFYGGLPKASNQEAIKDFKKAIELAPNRIIHHAGLAMVYEELGEKKLELEELKKCHELKPFDREDADEKKDAEKKLAELQP